MKYMTRHFLDEKMFRVSLGREDAFEDFRDAARSLIGADVAPADVTWSVGPGDLIGGKPPPQGNAAFSVPAAYVRLAETVVCHHDRERFALLYQLLWRITHGERELLAIASDSLVHRLERMAKSVRRDMHKMTAFLRFRRVAAEDGAEYFVAWFEPEHFILRRVADFFIGRFAAMRWSILTPQGALHWNGKDLSESAGVSREGVPSSDALDDWWRTYYRATFNPARANLDAMRAHMPKKYWHNMPETDLIPGLLAEADARTQRMVEQTPSAPRKAKAPELAPSSVADDATTISAVREQASHCERCPLYRNATQTVFGEGPADAPLVFVGEQPGDQEDLAGKPFVGPAGQMFDRALAEAGIERARVYVTNAVKHFKFEPRGKRRIHQKPNNGEIEACRWWLDKELELIQPRLTVALGATAARALTGRDTTISRARGRLTTLREGVEGFITVHPSFLLRLPDEAFKAREYQRFVEDLRLVAQHLPEIRKAA